MNMQYHVARGVNYLIVGIRCGNEATGGVEQVGGPPGEFRRDCIDRWKQKTIDCPSVIKISHNVSSALRRRAVSRIVSVAGGGPYVGGTYSMGDGAPRWR